MNLPLSATKHTGTIVYTKLYDLLKSSDRLEVMRFLTRLSKGPNPEAMRKLEKETPTMKQEETAIAGDKLEENSVNKTSRKAQPGKNKTSSKNPRKSSEEKLTTVENLGVYYARRIPGSEPVRRQPDSYSRKPNPTEEGDIVDIEKGDIADTQNNTGWNGDEETYVVELEDVSGNEEASGISVVENTGNGNMENSSCKTTAISEDVVLLEEVSDINDIEMFEETTLMDGVSESEETEIQRAVGSFASVEDFGEIMS